MQRDDKKILKISLLSLLFVFILIFAFFKSQALLFGVKIKNVSIIDGSKITENPFKITGNAKNASTLTINDREISINKAGDFNETIALLPGYNVISIKAKDKFGSSDEKNYKLMYEK